MGSTPKAKASKQRKARIREKLKDLDYSEVLEECEEPKTRHITGGMLREILRLSKNSKDGTIKTTEYGQYARISRKTIYNRFDRPLEFLKFNEERAVFELFTSEEINNGIKAYNVKYNSLQKHR